MYGKIIGTDLKSIRLHSGKTTQQLAKIAGASSRKTWENYENEKTHITLKSFIDVCQACELDIALIMHFAKLRKSETSLPLDKCRAMPKQKR